MTRTKERRPVQSVSLPRTIHQRLRAEARTEDLPISFIVRRALESFFAKEDEATRQRGEDEK